VMAHDRCKDWGETLHHHIYSGHVHKDRWFEGRGFTAESLRTLAARDAYAAGAGYRSGQSMRLDVWHAVHGLQNRHFVGVERVLPT
jgi:hypothetical protein